LADGCVHTIVTSPPYYGLRDYGTAKWQGGDPNCDHKGKPMATHAGFNERYFGKPSVVDKQSEVLEFYKNVCGKCGAIRIDAQIGLEQTPDEYIANLVEVFRECKRILRDDGTLWVNIGDSYARDPAKVGNGHPSTGKQATNKGSLYDYQSPIPNGLKPKDLIGIPWMLAFALRADGWWLRQDIIWCLSGGAFVYVKTQKGVMPMMVKDMARLDPSTVKLWNGDKWTQLLGVSKSERKGDELEIVLRSGERISCTPSHKFPTERGLLTASELTSGDILRSTTLPDVDNPRDCVLDEDAAWFAGLYIAEGSRQHGCIQIAGHSKEIERWERCNHIAKKFGGYATLTVDGNNQAIRIYGKVLNAILDELVSGTYASDKHFATVTWRYSNKFIASMLDGYLSGDGHWEAENNRWRLGFTRNYNLERDLRTACARLGYQLILNMSTVPYKGKDVPTFRGELRKERSTHHNNKNANEVMEIRKARCRYVYDLGVADEPHLFALASGILTHNSKPNPMPESVKDRCTKSHEYIFLLSKSARYYYDNEAVKEPANYPNDDRKARAKEEHKSMPDGLRNGLRPGNYDYDMTSRNKRDVWTVTTKPYKGAHYATYPPDLITPCILAGAPETCCAKCGAPYERVVERDRKARNELPKDDPRYRPNTYHGSYENINGKGDAGYTFTQTLGFQPTCTCNAGTSSGIVFDPFVGSGTTVMVARELGRRGIGLDLNMKYLDVNARERLASVQPLIFA